MPKERSTSKCRFLNSNFKTSNHIKMDSTKKKKEETKHQNRNGNRLALLFLLFGRKFEQEFPLQFL
jgi:hypothetical protein